LNLAGTNRSEKDSLKRLSDLIICHVFQRVNMISLNFFEDLRKKSAPSALGSVSLHLVVTKQSISPLNRATYGLIEKRVFTRANG
jgi:hypothetical protein